MTYLVRYGVMGYVGRFRASAELAGVFHRGRVVVIRSNRGVELGEVLTACDDPSVPDSISEIEPERSEFLEHGAAGMPYLCRAAGPEDLLLAKQSTALRPDQFSMCRSILHDDGWPWELLDVEQLLDGHTIVLHYLGPHELNAEGLLARFRVACNLDVVLEPVGIGVARDQIGAHAGEHGCGSGCGSSGCGSGGCASGGRVSSGSPSECTSCGISRWIADRRR